MRLEEGVTRRMMRLEVGGSQHDHTHWVLGLERRGYMVCSGLRLVGREHHAQLHQGLYHRQHPVGVASSRDVLWVRELLVPLGCTRGA